MYETGGGSGREVYQYVSLRPGMLSQMLSVCLHLKKRFLRRRQPAPAASKTKPSARLSLCFSDGFTAFQKESRQTDGCFNAGAKSRRAACFVDCTNEKTLSLCAAVKKKKKKYK